MKHYTCAVIGDWHNAHITAACLAHLGHSTALVNPTRDRLWSSYPKLELHEPGLGELVEYGQRENLLHYENGIGDHWSADFVWLAIDTPVDDSDKSDLNPLYFAADAVASCKAAKQAFVVSSQVPLGFCKRMEELFGPNVAHVPENLRLGKGVDTFLRCDRLVIGGSELVVIERVRNILKGIQCPVVECDLVTAEMVKHATNTFLSMSISFANEIARIGESRGVDSQRVATALKLDRRIGPGAYVAPGLGFAGGTLPRDLRSLQQLGFDSHIPTSLVDAVLTVNDSVVDAIADIIKTRVRELEDPSVMIVGYSYKADTNTLRRSPALQLAGKLDLKVTRVTGYDPFMHGTDLRALEGIIEHQHVWPNVAPDVTVVMTPRLEFRSLAWNALHTGHRDLIPMVLDTRGIIDSSAVLAAGLVFKPLWQPAQKPWIPFVEFRRQ